MNRTLLFTLATCAISAALLGQQSSSSTGVPKAQKIVFVCEHGAAKSIIAKQEFERLAKQKGLHVQAISRGTVPDAEIPKGIRDGLLADGMDVGAAKPVKIDAKDLKDAVKVVSFGPDLTEWMPKGAKAIDWSPTPSPSQDYRAARDYIRKQLEGLVADLRK
jgi:arsenate reductase